MFLSFKKTLRPREWELPYCYWSAGNPPSSEHAGGISRISLPGRHLVGSPSDMIPYPPRELKKIEREQQRRSVAWIEQERECGVLI